MCFSLNHSTSYPSVCLSLNSFCDETLRTWTPLSPEIRCDHEKILGSSPNLSCTVSVKETRPVQHGNKFRRSANTQNRGYLGHFEVGAQQENSVSSSTAPSLPHPSWSSQPQCNSLVLSLCAWHMSHAHFVEKKWMDEYYTRSMPFFFPNEIRASTALSFFKDREDKV